MRAQWGGSWSTDNQSYRNHQPRRMESRITAQTLATRYDPLKHFRSNCAFVKLAAMFIWRLPLILFAASGPIYWIGRAAGWL